MSGRYRVRRIRARESRDEARTVEVLATGQVVADGGEPLAVTRLGVGEYELTDGRRRVRAFVAGPPDAREVFVDGRVFRFEVTAAHQAGRKAGAPHPDTMTAPMPGTVITVLVQPGQQVRQGETLLKLEAMKMELPMRAPHDGIVAAVYCREGDLVQGGVRLLELAVEDSGAVGDNGEQETGRP